MRLQECGPEKFRTEGKSGPCGNQSKQGGLKNRPQFGRKWVVPPIWVSNFAQISDSAPVLPAGIGATASLCIPEGLQATLPEPPVSSLFIFNVAAL